MEPEGNIPNILYIGKRNNLWANIYIDIIVKCSYNEYNDIHINTHTYIQVFCCKGQIYGA